MRDRRPEGAIADDDPRLVGELHWHSTWMPFVTAGNVCLLVDTSDARPDGSAP